jgi:hypothetical protein
MARRALSITLEIDNVAWLKGRAGAAGESVSEMIDQLVTAARYGHGAAQAARSVAGTIDVDASDPLLEHADAALRAAFEESLGRPLDTARGRPVAVREARATYKTARARKATRRPHG